MATITTTKQIESPRRNQIMIATALNRLNWYAWHQAYPTPEAQYNAMIEYCKRHFNVEYNDNISVYSAAATRLSGYDPAVVADAQIQDDYDATVKAASIYGAV